MGDKEEPKKDKEVTREVRREKQKCWNPGSQGGQKCTKDKETSAVWNVAGWSDKIGTEKTLGCSHEEVLSEFNAVSLGQLKWKSAWSEIKNNSKKWIADINMVMLSKILLQREQAIGEELAGMMRSTCLGIIQQKAQTWYEGSGTMLELYF